MANQQINLPGRLLHLLEADRSLAGAVALSLNDFEVWLADNKLVFFQEYTDHGLAHVSKVIETAVSLIRDDAWPVLTPADAAALVLSSVLHDCAMHLSEDGFLCLLSDTFPSQLARKGDEGWRDLWEKYIPQASRFDARTLTRLFGDDQRPRRPPSDPRDWTKRDRLLIGDFLRRHHARLAHEIAVFGVPGPTNERLKFT